MNEQNATVAAQASAAEDAENVSLTEMHDLCREYADAFGLMAHLCNKEVDQPLLDKLMETLYPLSSGNENVTRSSRLIAGWLSKTWEGALDELRADYTATFIGHGSDGHSAAYPLKTPAHARGTYRSAGHLPQPGLRQARHLAQQRGPHFRRA